MILRRVIAHFRKQEWTAIGIDFLIVVIGVFVGLQVSNWNAERGDRLRERQIVADMLADLEIDRAQYADAMTVAVRRVAAANASLERAGLAPMEFDYVVPNLYDDDFVATAQDVSSPPETLWTDIVIGYFPTPSTATYDALVGAGDTRIIRDRTLVRAIQTYRNLIGSVIRQNDKLTTIRQETLNAGAKHGLAPYARLEPDDYFELVKSQPELAAAIRISATFTIFHHGDIRSADAQAAMLQSALNAMLGDG